MSLDEILNSASRHRIEAIIGNGARQLDDIAERSRQLDKDWEKTRARQSEELKGLEEKMKAAREAQQAAKQPDEPAKREAPRVRSLSLGGEEFREARRAEQVVQPPLARPVAPQPPPPRPEPEPEVEVRPKAARTMRIGAADDEEPKPEPKPPERERPRREPRRDSDDDLSGRTWLR